MSRNLIGVFPIVEGHGEISAVPALLRRFGQEKYYRYDFDILTPFRLPRSKYSKDDELKKALLLASLKLNNYEKPHIVVMMDADDDCPAEEQARMTRLILSLNLGIPVSLILPYREYESWFNTSIIPGTEHVNFKAPFIPVVSADLIRDAKGYFEREYLLEGIYYSETVDQQKYTFLIDLDAENDRSFRKMKKEMNFIFG